MYKILPESLIKKLLDENPYVALQALCEKYQEFYRESLSKSENQTIELYSEAISAHSFIQSFASKWQLQPTKFAPESNRNTNIKRLTDLVFEISGKAEKKYSEIAAEEASEKYDSMFGNIYSYKIPEKDFQRIQTLVNELRDQINKSKEIKEEHKKRLIKRLDKLQSELNKDMANFDRFWGVAIEVSGHIGIVCENIKPFFDTINEMVDIVTKIMKLATGQFLLEPPADFLKQLKSNN